MSKNTTFPLQVQLCCIKFHNILWSMLQGPTVTGEVSLWNQISLPSSIPSVGILSPKGRGRLRSHPGSSDRRGAFLS